MTILFSCCFFFNGAFNEVYEHQNQNSLSSVVTAPELVSTAVFFHTLLQFLQSSHFFTDFSGFCHFRDQLKAGPLKVV